MRIPIFGKLQTHFKMEAIMLNLVWTKEFNWSPLTVIFQMEQQ